MERTRQMAAMAQLRLQHPQTDPDDAPIVMLTTAQLQQLVQDAVIKALEEHRAGERPEQATLSGVALAKRLGLSRNVITRLRKAGMPVISLGEGYRYELQPCLRWLRQQSGDQGADGSQA